VFAVLGWRSKAIPTMVQRGYYAGIFVLLALFFSSQDGLFVEYVRTSHSAPPSHRLTSSTFENVA
jgi:hypothetical protein